MHTEQAKRHLASFKRNYGRLKETQNVGASVATTARITLSCAPLTRKEVERPIKHHLRQEIVCRTTTPTTTKLIPQPLRLPSGTFPP